MRAVLTGKDTNLLCGAVLEDRPPLARDKVRYFGEPVALVIADGEAEAMRGAQAVKIRYAHLPLVGSVAAALRDGAPRVHEKLGEYKIAQPPVAPQAGTNIADHAKIRKGDPAKAFAKADRVIEAEYVLPQIDHAAMEVRCARAEILPDSRIQLHCASQAPFEVQKMIARYFQVGQGQVIVHTPLVGGGFGGKAAVQLEVLAVLAARAVDGRLVKVVNTREQDLTSSPTGSGLTARIKLGATREGRLVAAELTYHLDIGAYTDSSPRIARAIASACTGPYAIEHVRADVYCVYTNHIYATAFRGFGYMPMATAIERSIDKLADALGIDAVELRRLNAAVPGDRTPTQVELTRNLIGDLPACLERAGRLIGWEQGRRTELGDGKVRGKGLACFWKTSSSPTDAVSGAVVTMNQEGSVNLSIGAVELGPGTKTAAAQVLAERMQLPLDKVHVHMDVDTLVDPEHWKTVASMSTYMVGQAVIKAADDALHQLKNVAAVVLRCPVEDLAVSDGAVHLRDDRDLKVAFKDIAHGYTYPDGDSIGGQVIGRGSFIMRHLTLLDEETGKGMPGPSWTVGAVGVEVELDRDDFTYKILEAVAVIDAGRVLNPQIARGVVMGGLCQGLGYGTRECMKYDEKGRVLTDQFRSYRTMRMGEQPAYAVEFVETPQVNAPYGARPIGEHGILAAPAAVANALVAAAGVELDHFPVTPETVWREAMR